MSINSTLDVLISDGNSNQIIINNLLAQLKSETLRSDNPALYPPPIYDDVNNTWTLTQDTANGQGVYEGIYRLPNTDVCSAIEIVNIVSHQNPGSGAPASWRGCDPSDVFVDESSVSALDGKQINAIKIRSGAPFEVEVRVKQYLTWCYELDFANPAFNTGLPLHNWVSTPIVSGSGITAAVYPQDGRYSRAEFSFYIELDDTTTITSYDITYTNNHNAQLDTKYFVIFGYPVSLQTGLPQGTHHLSQSGLNWERKSSDNPVFQLNLDGWTNTGAITIHSMKLTGTGPNPFGDDNCA